MTTVGIRGRLLLVVVAAVAVAVVGLVAAFNVVLARTLDRDASNLVRSRATAERGLLRTDGGRLSVQDAPNDAADDASVWIFSDGRTVEQPRSSAIVGAAARSLRNRGPRYLDVASADLRLYAEPVVVGGRRLGTVVDGVSLAPYEQTRRVTLISSLVFGGVVLLLVGVAARWLLASTLRPVRRMIRQAAAWSERDLDHRFGLGKPHDELTELAATLDGLLDRLAAGLRHEQLFSAELSHELRTPLARVIAESELALRREREPAEYRLALEKIHANGEQLARIVDALVAAARHQTGSERGTSDAARVATDVEESLRPLAREHRVVLAVARPDQPIRIGVDADFAARILQPVIENAIRYCASSVSVSISRSGSIVRFTVDDDGIGVGENELERIFAPGVRGRTGAVAWAGGSGLGLSLARRLAHSVSGEIAAVGSAGGGRFAIDLPTG